MEYVVECKNLTHYYGRKLVYENMNFNIKRGSIFGLLGKNGTGKTTTINILNGFLKPASGTCLIFGEDSQKLSPQTKTRIGFLMEGHIQYSFMNIYQIEKFYSSFFPRWKKAPYYELMSKLQVEPGQKISRMSCGQRSQVALGLILAQDPDLMILDDYSMGLDVGYRRLFLDYLAEYATAEDKTVFVTSHIIQDLERIINDFVVLDYRGVLLSMAVKEFQETFHEYRFDTTPDLKLTKDNLVRNFEIIGKHAVVYSFAALDEIKSYLNSQGIQFDNLNEVPMTLEDAIIGLSGKY
ncbi:MAG: ABC transporter ATP-binding protein [Candidatus Neomarinimicrobiota bacterium]